MFAVDDAAEMTELYAVLLVEAGYNVRAFNDRGEALEALRRARHKPDLLITDYIGPAISPEEFINACRAVHPKLRILMASGFSQVDACVAGVAPDRFIAKPFTAAELLQEVNAALAA